MAPCSLSTLVMAWAMLPLVMSRLCLQRAASKPVAGPAERRAECGGLLEDAHHPAYRCICHTRTCTVASDATLDKIDLLRTECARLKTDDRMVDWEASLWYTETDTLYLTTDGGRVYQHFVYLVPMLSATANAGSETQTRTFGGRGYCRQGPGSARRRRLSQRCPTTRGRSVAITHRPNCPAEVMDVLLAPDQMILQIHESVGHPLELDRILGDERNYAGTSFVTPDMFGTYRYGSDRLNITFDPTRPEQYVSYGFDDDGQPARREYLIRQGILQRALGGLTSQVQADLPGVANSRLLNEPAPY